MHATTLVIGACRSGKSSHALRLGERLCGRSNFFVATCQPQDVEMAARIKNHQRERGDRWHSIEAPLDLISVIDSQGPGANILLIDCLTLWISNLMIAHADDSKVLAAVDRLHQSILAPPCPIILVSNEVGAGIVPVNAMARRFRDLTGWCNQKMAAACTHVVWMVAGIAVPIKGSG